MKLLAAPCNGMLRVEGPPVKKCFSRPSDTLRNDARFEGMNFRHRLRIIKRSTGPQGDSTCRKNRSSTIHWLLENPSDTFFHCYVSNTWSCVPILFWLWLIYLKLDTITIRSLNFIYLYNIISKQINILASPRIIHKLNLLYCNWN